MSREKTQPHSNGRISILGQFIRPLRQNPDNIVIKLSAHHYHNSLVHARTFLKSAKRDGNIEITNQNSVLLPNNSGVILTGRKLDATECQICWGETPEDGEAAITMDIEEFCRAADIYKQ